MVQVQSGTGLGHQPFVAGDRGAAVVDDEVRGVQLNPDLPADQANRHRVAVRADGDPAEPVDAWAQPGAGPERLVRQRRQLRLLDGEVLADGMRAGADAPGVVGGICRPMWRWWTAPPLLDEAVPATSL